MFCIRHAIRNRAARFLLVMATLGLLAAGQGQAQQPPSIKIKETAVIDAVGDCKFSVDIKMPTAMYTTIKARNPNTALLLRELGLSNFQWMEIQDIKGTFEDGSNTISIQWRTRGLARMVRDGLWETPLADAGMDVVAIHDNMAIFSTAANTELGLASYMVHVTVPAGGKELQMLKSPVRLAYRLAVPTAGGSKTSVDFTFHAKTQIMSCLAKSYGSSKFSKMWVARTVLRNQGDQAVRDYRVRFRVAEYTATWSPWQQCEQVVPGQTVVDAFFPVFDLEKMGKTASSRRATLEVEYRYVRADGKEVQESDSKTLQVLGRNEVFFSSLPNDEQVGFHDHFDYGPALLASFVTRDDPIIQQVAGWVSGQANGAAASLSDEEAMKFLKALYDFMAVNQIAYQTPPGANFNGQFGQHIKYGRDVLQNRAGTCIDLAILYGSVCEAVGLEPILYLIPGHCFPAVRLPKSRQIVGVESTMVGKYTFQQAVKKGMEEVKEANDKGPCYAVSIDKLRDLGVYGLELPTLPATTLADWNIKPVKYTTTTVTPPSNTNPTPAPNPNPNPNPRPPTPIPAALVGVWEATAIQNGQQVTQWAYINADHTYKIYLWNAAGKIINQDKGIMVYSNESMMIKSDDGYWEIANLTFIGNNKIIYKKVRSSDPKQVGSVVTFTRAKS